jgi:hypothetical protein
MRAELDSMTPAEIKALRKAAKPAEIVRFAEAVFGRAPTEPSTTKPTDAPLTEAQLARLRAALDEDE